MEEQRVILENRNKMTVSQVVDVDAFDEETLWANLADGAVEVSGSGLHIEKLDLAEGVLVVTGSISSFAYIAVSYTHLDVYKRQRQEMW